MPLGEIDRNLVDSSRNVLAFIARYGCTNYGGYRTFSTYRIRITTWVVHYRARANLNCFCKDHLPRVKWYIAIFRESSRVNDSYNSRGSVLAEVTEK